MDAIDPLDAMLGQSAPEAVTVTPQMRRELSLMTSLAARGVNRRTHLSRRASRVFLGLGVAIALTGTATAATAAGAFTWLPWAQHPDVAYSFTLPSGRECEGRIVLQKEAVPGDWGKFVESMRVLQVDPADIENVASDIRDSNSLVVVTDDGTIEDRPPGSVPKTEDGTYAAANWVAVKMATVRLSAAAGVALSWDSEGQVQCEAVAP